MRVQILREDDKRQTGQQTIDLSRPFGHIATLTAVLLDDEGESVGFPPDSSFEWTKHGRPVASAADCLPHQLIVDVMKGTEPGWAEDLYRVRVTVPEESNG